MRSTKGYRAGVEGMRGRDYIRHLPQLMLHGVRLLSCKLGCHEWHWFRQFGGGKKKICVRCDKYAHPWEP